MKKLIFILIVLPFLATSCIQDKAKNQSNETAESMPETRAEELSDEILNDPNNPNLYIKRALEYKSKNLYDLAIRDVERALSIDPSVSYFHTVKGEIYFTKGDLKEARLSLEKAVAYDETNTEALLKLGEVNFLLRRYDDALIIINDALKVDDKLAQGYFIKGFIYKELGDTTLAVSSFQTATEVNPEHYEAYMELGNILAYKGDPLALEYFETALMIRPESAEALYNKGMYHQANQQIDEAMETYQRLIKVDPNSFLGYYNTGYIYLVEYLSFDTAIAYFDTVLAIDPTYIDARFNQGLCFEEKGENVKAEEIYREVLNADPQYTAAAMGLERLLD